MILEKQIKCLALSQQIKQLSVLVHVFFVFPPFHYTGQLWCDSTALSKLVKQILSYIPAA